jgi:glycosyltransferase involved in cell wall biosynthesis
MENRLTRKHQATIKDKSRLPKCLVCFSHLRWDFVYQRPQQILERLSEHFDIVFIEEPTYGGEQPQYRFTTRNKVTVATPQIPSVHSEEQVNSCLYLLLRELLASKSTDYIFWYYTPMSLIYSFGFNPALTIYDCMDELSGFKFASASLPQLEQKLFKAADVVFTGGHSLYHAKKRHHHNIHPFPSSIDATHFNKGRCIDNQPDDQANIALPRLGFFGVIDERLDIELIEQIAIKRPDWQIVLIGPVVKIDPSTLPRASNIHYLGNKSYSELPAYLSGWNVAMIPFLLNESTRYISPTKTPEYLAAGIPVVSTPIHDVVDPYGNSGLVEIAATANDFITAAEKSMHYKQDKVWLEKVDNFLSSNSWNITVAKMLNHISTAYNLKYNP